MVAGFIYNAIYLGMNLIYIMYNEIYLGMNLIYIMKYI